MLDGLEEADRLFDRAVKLGEAVVKEKATARYLGRLGGTLHNRALHHIYRKEWDKASPWLERAIERQTAALKLGRPADWQLIFLVNHHHSLARIRREQDRKFEAAALLRQLMELLADHPSILGGKESQHVRFSQWENDRAVDLFNAGQTRAGEAAFKRSVALLKEIDKPAPAT